MELNLSDLSKMQDQLIEITDHVTNLVQKAWEYPVADILPKEKEAHKDLDNIMDTLGELNIQTMELQRISLNLTLLKRSLVGVPHITKGITDSIGEIKNEVHHLIQTIRTAIYALRDRMNYMKLRLEL